MPRRQRAVGVALVALAAALALVSWTQHTPDRGAEAAPLAHASSAPAAPASAAPASADGARAPAVVSSDRFTGVLAQYRRDAIYPPGSRPLDAGARYKLRWNDAIVSELPFADGLSYHFAADRHHVTFGEALTSWIEVWHTGDERRRVPVRVVQAWVLTTAGPGQGRTIPLVYRDDGQGGDAVAGDHRYTNRFVPSQHDELRTARPVQLFAEVAGAGLARAMIRDFTYAPRPVLEVVRVSDALANGSLAVTVACEVFEAGLYTFEANAVTAGDGAPIAYVDQSFTLAAGRQEVTLVFFGRVFTDAGLPGPYEIRDLRGFRRFVDGEEPNLWWSHPARHTTRAYAVSDFSEAEWDAPEKREKLRRLEAARAAAP